LESSVVSLIDDFDPVATIRNVFNDCEHLDVSDVDRVLCGGADGPDMWGAEFADANDIPVERYNAFWDLDEKRGGFMRNHHMARNADVLIAFHHQNSAGTQDMIDRAREEGVAPIVIDMDDSDVRQSMIATDDDDDESSSSYTVDADDRFDLEAVFQVGPTRGMRFRRDTDIETIRDLANADLDELQEVWSVGPTRAGQIKGSAQGWLNTQRENARSETNDVTIPGTQEGHRVFIAAGTDVMERIQMEDEHDVRSTIGRALARADIDLTSNVTFGMSNGDALGGKYVREWYQEVARTSDDLVQKREIAVPFEKYARWVAPLRFVDDEYLEKHFGDPDLIDNDDPDVIARVPDERLPDTPDPIDDTPLNAHTPDEWLKDLTKATDEQRQGDGWRVAYMEQRELIAEWADEVVIVVDGEHTHRLRDSCKFHDGARPVPCTTVFDGETPSEDSLNKYMPDMELEVWEPEEDQTYGVRGKSRGATTTEMDEEQMHLSSDHQYGDDRIDENDLNGGDPGGKGVGSKSYDVL
jgi:hypothetical protein